jgi:hypothetical protein
MWNERAKFRPKWGTDAGEPALVEVLADPVVHLVMRRDGVTLDQLRAVIARAQARLRRDPCCRCAA